MYLIVEAVVREMLISEYCSVSRGAGVCVSVLPDLSSFPPLQLHYVVVFLSRTFPTMYIL